MVHLDALDEMRTCRMMEPLKEGDECTGRFKHTLPVCQFNPDVEWIRMRPGRPASGSGHLSLDQRNSGH